MNSEVKTRSRFQARFEQPEIIPALDPEEDMAVAEGPRHRPAAILFRADNSGYQMFQYHIPVQFKNIVSRVQFIDRRTLRAKRKGGVSDCTETPPSYGVDSSCEGLKHPSIHGGFRFPICSWQYAREAPEDV